MTAFFLVLPIDRVGADDGRGCDDDDDDFVKNLSLDESEGTSNFG